MVGSPHLEVFESVGRKRWEETVSGRTVSGTDTVSPVVQSPDSLAEVDFLGHLIVVDGGLSHSN